MNLVRTVLFAMALLALAPSSLLAQRQRPVQNMGETSRVEFELRRWRSDLFSELRLSGGGIPGTTVDPTEDLGLPAERIWDYQFGLRITRRLKARGNWLEVKYEGEARAVDEICLAGICAPPDSTINSRLELEELRVGAEFDVLHGAYGYLAVLGEYGRIDLRTEFASGESSVTPELQRIELPLLGVKARVYLTPALALTVEGAGMKQESEGVMTDFDAMATYNMIPNLAVSYGYRNSYNRFKALEPGGDRAVVRLRGQYVAFTVRF